MDRKILRGTTERRGFNVGGSTKQIELRDAGDNNLEFTGYASVFNRPYQMGWGTEIVDPRAFDVTLSQSPDVVMNLGHGSGGSGLPIARTTSGTLRLSADSIGLRVSASLDKFDPDVAALIPKIRRGDVGAGSMSFAFKVIRDRWDDHDDGSSTRTLIEISLARGDVAVVAQGANDGAHVVGLRGLLQTLSPRNRQRVLQEVRSRGGDLDAALESLLERSLRGAGGMDLDTARAMAMTSRLRGIDKS